RAVVRLRARRPACQLRALRQRPCGGQPDRAQSARRHPGSHPAHGAGVAPTHQPHRGGPAADDGRQVMSRTVLGLALLATGLALAAPEAPPTPGPTPPFELPTTTVFSLKNGLKVTLVPYGAIPKTHVALSVQLGNADEAAHQTGLADLMGTLLLQGTTSKSAVQLAEAAAQLGGELEARVLPEQTLLEIECLGASTADASRLVAEVARTPAFPTAELARLRGDLVRNVAIQRSQSQPLAEEAFAQAIYGNHPYGRILPVQADVEK